MIENFLDVDTPSCDKYKTVNALLLGGGRAGINILQIFELYDWLHLDGVVDQDESAPGMQLASALGVPTFINVTVALQQFEGDLVVDATGDSAVSSEVMLYCSRMGKEYISGMSAKLFFHLAHTHVKEKHEIQEQALRVEMLKTMLQIYQKLGAQSASDHLVSQGMQGSAKFVVSNKAIALECGEKNIRILGGLGIEPLPTNLPMELVESLMEELRSVQEVPVIELSKAVKLEKVEGEFGLAVPLFIEGNFRYLLLFQLEGSLLGRHRAELSVLVSHLQHALETENRQRILLELAYRDSLTGIYNRRFFDERLQQEADRFQRFAHGRLAIMFIDLDHFKLLNDQYGHIAADKVLQDVVLSIQEQLRSYDVLARYGGDEFVVMLLGVEEEQVLNIAKRVLAVTSELAAQNGASEIHSDISFSMGIAMAETGSEIDAADLLKRADQALYRAKKMGRKQFQIL